MKYFITGGAGQLGYDLIKELKKRKQDDYLAPTIEELDITDLIINAVKRGLGIGYVIKDAVKEDLKNKTIYEVHTDIELPKTIIYLINIKEQLTNANKKLIKEYLLK